MAASFDRWEGAGDCRHPGLLPLALITAPERSAAAAVAESCIRAFRTTPKHERTSMARTNNDSVRSACDIHHETL